MLQVNMQPYASDALEDAMNLAQIKALNSFTFSDCMNYLNYAWSDIYNRIACIDDGYYAETIRLTSKLTILPPYVKNSIQIYRAQSPAGFNRQVYRESGPADLNSSGTYSIKGFELWCPDAVMSSIWLRYIPACPMLFFTHHNRDPKIYEDDIVPVINKLYSVWELQYSLSNEQTAFSAQLKSRADHVTIIDITEKILPEEGGVTLSNDELLNSQNYYVTYMSCDYPYIFVSFKHKVTGEYISGFFDKDILDDTKTQEDCWNEYNPFAYTGRMSNVEYVKCKFNDKTGMGVIVRDYNDPVDKDHKYTLKELGWTPDTLLQYPKPEMYRYLVARLADKFSALNESNILGVQKELTEAKYAFEACLETNKSSFKRITNVNVSTVADFL